MHVNYSPDHARLDSFYPAENVRFILTLQKALVGGLIATVPERSNAWCQSSSFTTSSKTSRFTKSVLLGY